MALNGTKQLQITHNDSKLTQKAPNGSKLLKVALTGSTCFQIAPNGSKYIQIAPSLQKAPNGSKLLHVAINCSKFLKTWSQYSSRPWFEPIGSRSYLFFSSQFAPRLIQSISCTARPLWVVCVIQLPEE